MKVNRSPTHRLCSSCSPSSRQNIEFQMTYSLRVRVYIMLIFYLSKYTLNVQGTSLLEQLLKVNYLECQHGWTIHLARAPLQSCLLPPKEAMKMLKYHQLLQLKQINQKTLDHSFHRPSFDFKLMMIIRHMDKSDRFGFRVPQEFHSQCSFS